MLLAGALAAATSACSPVYVIKAGIAEAKILRARRAIPEVVADPATDAETRGKLAWVMEARRFAIEGMGIDAGDAYTMYTKLDRDTLALVLSAAEKDRLAPKTWWFPVVGRVPYKGFFGVGDAVRAQERLERDGYDTHLRPTAAFSTLGWFNDPILSTALRADEVDVVETVLHELTHNFLFLPGQVTFNESFANFAGRVGAIEFFCNREGSGPHSVKCLRAQARWRDAQRFSAFLDGLVDELREIYASDSPREEKLSRREAAFAAALARFDTRVVPTFEESHYQGFRRTPLNNATLLARLFYYHRLPDFQALFEGHGGDLRATLDAVRRGVRGLSDPFDILPAGSPPPRHPPDRPGHRPD
jgi:predicted aminopeptidase